MSYEPDEMSDGAKLAVSLGLLAVGGLAAWWAVSPGTKTAGAAGTSNSWSDADYQSGYAVGQHQFQMMLWNEAANPGKIVPMELPPPHKSRNFLNGWNAGWNAARSAQQIQTRIEPGDRLGG